MAEIFADFVTQGSPFTEKDFQTSRKIYHYPIHPSISEKIKILLLCSEIVHNSIFWIKILVISRNMITLFLKFSDRKLL